MYIYIYIFIPVQTLLIYFRNRHLYQNLACGAHFQFNNHGFFENLKLNLLIQNNVELDYLLHLSN